MIRKLYLSIIILILSTYIYCITINSISFEGNEIVIDKELEKIVKSKKGDNFSYDSIIDDMERIADYYKSKHLYLTEIALPEVLQHSSNSVNIVFHISNERRMLVNEVEFIGNHYFSDSKLKEILHLSFPIELSQINSILQQLSDIYLNRNYLFINTSVHELIETGAGYKVVIDIDEGKPCHFTNFSFRGNKITKDKILLKISGLSTDRTLTPDVFEQASENVRKKEYIKTCDIYPINDKTLLFDVVEDKMTYFSGLAGYDNSEDKKNRFSGYLNFKFLNLFGTDRNLNFNWEQYPSDYSKLNLFYEDSGPINIPIGGSLSLTRIEQDSTYIDTGVTTELYYYNLKNKYGIEFSFSDITAGSRRPILIQPEKQYSAGVFWNYSDVDYYINPTNGMDFNVRFRFTNVIADSSSTNREHTEISWNNYEEIIKYFVMKVGISGNYVTDHNVEIYNQYQMGGFNSLRGFTENRFNGFFTGWSSLELRYLLNRDSRIHLFFDYGVLMYQDVLEEKSQYNLIGTGLGIRLKTAVGLLGIDYALGYDSQEWTSPMNGMLHFGFETKF